MQTVKKRESNNNNNNNTMALLHENNTEFELEDSSDEDHADDARCQGLIIRRTTSYSTRTNKSSAKSKLSPRETLETIAVNQAIACALKSPPKAFYYTQKQLQYLPPSIKYLGKCRNIRELDLHGNQLKSLPDIRPPSSFRIKQTNSYDVTHHFARIKHGIPASLPKIYIEFPSLTLAKSFKCTFELRPANLTSPVTGELHFVIESKENA